MSSAKRSFGAISQTTKFQKVTTPEYYDYYYDVDTDISYGVQRNLPIPFSYSNGVLDIHIQDEVQRALIDEGEYPGQDTDFQCKTIGMPRLVTSLGPKMLEWLEGFLPKVSSYDTPIITAIQLHTPGQVVKAQFALSNTISGAFLRSDVDDSTYAITSTPPSGDEYVFGTASDNFRTVYIFKTPLTISYKDNGTPRYLTLFSNYAAND
jgi:hypothetical protein